MGLSYSNVFRDIQEQLQLMRAHMNNMSTQIIIKTLQIW
jgi:hypothetical protein